MEQKSMMRTLLEWWRNQKARRLLAQAHNLEGRAMDYAKEARYLVDECFRMRQAAQERKRLALSLDQRVREAGL